MQIEIFQDKNQLYFFCFKDKDGRTLFTSNGYTDEISAKRKIESAIVVSNSIDFFARNTAPNGKHYFTLKDKDGTILGTSLEYSSKQELESAITTLLNESSKK